MKMSRFKADDRLWVPLMAVLFALLWFAPFIVSHATGEPNPYEPKSLSWGLFDSVLGGQSSDVASTGVLLLLLCTALITGTVAFASAWLLQFPIVIFRNFLRPNAP